MSDSVSRDLCFRLRKEIKEEEERLAAIGDFETPQRYQMLFVGGGLPPVGFEEGDNPPGNPRTPTPEQARKRAASQAYIKDLRRQLAEEEEQQADMERPPLYGNLPADITLDSPQKTETQKGRPHSAMIDRRRSIVREMMTTATDFNDSTKVSRLFAKLDAEKIQLPTRNGSYVRSGTYQKLQGEPRRLVIQSLKKDLQR